MGLRLGTFSLLLFAVLAAEISAGCPDWECGKRCLVYEEDENGCPVCECKKNFDFVDDIKMYPALRTFMNSAFQTDASSQDSLNADVLHAGTTDFHRKWNNLADGKGGWIIPYEFDVTITNADMIELIHESIADLENFTCLTFVERTDQESYMLFQDNSPSPCWSYVGRLIPTINGDINRIQLRQHVPGFGSCQVKGTVLHEIMHALGFFHEHQRVDRDDSVIINESNIIPGREGNFLKLEQWEWESFGSPYDLVSVMQYRDNAFSLNGLPTITDINGDRFSAQRTHLADSDIFQINAMFDCPAAVTTNPVTMKPETSPVVTMEPETSPVVTMKPETSAVVTMEPETSAVVTMKPETSAVVTMKPETSAAVTTMPEETTIIPRVCEDKIASSRCEKRKGDRKCFTRPTMMKEKCELTCKFCDCEDMLDDCATRKSNGDCYRRSSIDFMKAYCPITCGFCRGGCLNNNTGADCKERANNGECESRFNYMARRCRRRCKHCIRSNV